MIVSYCKKCNLDSEGTVCTSCGKRASASCVRDVWRIIRVPGADASTWRSLASGILLTALVVEVTDLYIAAAFPAAGIGHHGGVGCILNAVDISHGISSLPYHGTRHGELLCIN